MKSQYPADGRCPDGWTCDGWRKVRSGGRVKLHDWWYHPDLLNHVGDYVFIVIGDGLATSATVQTEQEYNAGLKHRNPRYLIRPTVEN